MAEFQVPELLISVHPLVSNAMVLVDNG